MFSAGSLFNVLLYATRNKAFLGHKKHFCKIYEEQVGIYRISVLVADNAINTTDAKRL